MPINPTTIPSNPTDILNQIASTAPQLNPVQIPNAEPVPNAPDSAPGLSAVFTPQFADALSLQAMTGHPGQNGSSAVLGSIVSAHQQIANAQESTSKAKAARRKSLMKQAKDTVDTQIAIDKVQATAAGALLRNETSKKAIDVQQTSTANARLNAQDAATSRVEAANVKATGRTEAAAITAHTQVLKSAADGIKAAQAQLKNAQTYLSKVAKQTLDISGNPVPFTPAQNALIKEASTEVAAVKHRISIATARADVVQTIAGVEGYGKVGGVDISNTPQFRTLPTAQWDATRLVTVLYTTPNFARIALTDPLSGTVIVRDINPTVPNGVKLMYKLSTIPSLGITFDKSVTPPAPAETLPTPTQLPPYLQGATGAQLHDQLVAPPKTSLLNGR